MQKNLSIIIADTKKSEISHINEVNKSTKKLGFDYKIIELLYKFEKDTIYNRT